MPAVTGDLQECSAEWPLAENQFESIHLSGNGRRDWKTLATPRVDRCRFDAFPGGVSIRRPCTVAPIHRPVGAVSFRRLRCVVDVNDDAQDNGITGRGRLVRHAGRMPDHACDGSRRRNPKLHDR